MLSREGKKKKREEGFRGCLFTGSKHKCRADRRNTTRLQEVLNEIYPRRGSSVETGEEFEISPSRKGPAMGRRRRGRKWDDGEGRLKEGREERGKKGN